MPISDDVTKTIEAAIADRHVLDVTYESAEKGEEHFLVEPLAIRTSTAGNRVLWVWVREGEHLAELLWDRISGAVDTAEVFEPREWEPAG